MMLSIGSPPDKAFGWYFARLRLLLLDSIRDLLVCGEDTKEGWSKYN